MVGLRCSKLSPGTIILNAEAGAAPSPSWEHHSGARCCARGTCKGLAALLSFPGLCPVGKQGVASKPPNIAQVGLQKADISSPSFFLRHREGHLSPPGSGGNARQWSCSAACSHAVPLNPHVAAHQGVLCHAGADRVSRTATGVPLP